MTKEEKLPRVPLKTQTLTTKCNKCAQLEAELADERKIIEHYTYKYEASLRDNAALQEQNIMENKINFGLDEEVLALQDKVETLDLSLTSMVEHHEAETTGLEAENTRLRELLYDAYGMDWTKQALKGGDDESKS